MSKVFQWRTKDRIEKDILDSDILGIKMAEVCAKEMKPYVPAETNTLKQSYRVKPFLVEYRTPYAHYQWQGISRFSGRKLNYSHEMSLNAQDHWEKAVQKDRQFVIANELTNYIKRAF